jgi:hypothetical protein
MKFISIQAAYNILILPWTHNCNKMDKNNGKAMSEVVD